MTHNQIMMPKSVGSKRGITSVLQNEINTLMDALAKFIHTTLADYFDLNLW